MSTGPKLFTCPRCRQTYLGHDPLPDCPRCGYDYRVRDAFRWDVVVYLLAILGLASFLLVASNYRGWLAGDSTVSQTTSRGPSSDGPGSEKLPGSDRSGRAPFQSPYLGSGR